MSEKVKILKNFLGAPFFHGEEVLFRCPKCKHHKRKLSVNISKNVFKCWVCSFAGNNITSLVKKYAPRSERDAWGASREEIDYTEVERLFEPPTAITPQLSLPAEFQTLTTPTLCRHGKLASEYLKSRSCDRSRILKYRIGFCSSGKYAGRVVIPSFDATGELNYFISRTYRGADPKYMNPPTSKDVIFGELDVDWDKDITIVEGVFDSMEVDNSIPILGSVIHERSKLFTRLAKFKKRVFVALDSDAIEKSYKIVKLLSSYGIDVRHVKITGKKDISDMGSEEFKTLKNESNFLDKNDYLLYKLNTL